MTLFKVPKSVLVPFEWDGWRWVKRNDLPRFREDAEAAHYLGTHPEVSFREGKSVPLNWIERYERVFIDEYMRGVGTPEWLSLHKG